MAHGDRLLLVIDLQVVVAPGGAWELPAIETVVDAATRLVDQHGGPAIASRHVPVPDDHGTLGPFARQDDPSELTADAAELVPGLAHLPSADKRSYSAFRCPEVREAVRQVDSVLVCGVETDCCVLATVYDLLDEGVRTLVVPEATTGPDPVSHDGALRTMSRLGELVQVRRLADVLAGRV
jgi:nicotinamidase-related amidase